MPSEPALKGPGIDTVEAVCVDRRELLWSGFSTISTDPLDLRLDCAYLQPRRLREKA